MTTTTVTDEQALNYHLMHPGEDSSPGDPNAAFYLDGIYHLHYILRHSWRGEISYSFVHVTSPDMMHWRWQTTKLQPSFTGHGMYSGTGFITKEGRPAAIYHGQASGRNHIAIAKDRQISAWEKPLRGRAEDRRRSNTRYAPLGSRLFLDRGQLTIRFPADTIRLVSALARLAELDLCRRPSCSHDLPGTAIGEDISCPNFFRLGDKWMLLCISHPYGCRYYLGDWDADREQFVPQSHGRMNWRRQEQSLYTALDRDYFAPESVLAPDGRRVMWAWLRSMPGEIAERSIQSLPRELSLGADGGLRMNPLRELESLRYAPLILSNVTVESAGSYEAMLAGPALTELDGDAYEIRITVDQSMKHERKRFGVQLFADEVKRGTADRFLAGVRQITRGKHRGALLGQRTRRRRRPGIAHLH